MSDIAFIEVNGMRLAYQRLASRPGRTALVFFHGYALHGTGRVYRELFDRLQDDFDVYALDMRGHGASADAYEEWSKAALADDAAAFVRALGMNHAVCAGHSLGGFTAMYAQIRHPGTFSALLLLATAVASGGAAPPEVAQHFTKNARNHEMMRETFASTYFRPNEEHLDASARAVALVHPSVHQEFFSKYSRYVITEELCKIDVPVLMVNGAKETVVDLWEQHKTASGLPKCKEVTFSTDGHMLPIEAPAATAREMIKFCRDDIPDRFRHNPNRPVWLGTSLHAA